MIAKCVALLAVVTQISGYVCNSNIASPLIATGYGNSGILGSGLVGSSGEIRAATLAGATASSRNIVAKGKYPVALENTGPVPDSRVPVSTSHVQAPVQEKPTVRLSARIPAPRTVAHSCTCYKQILRPKVHDQYITVPSVQRYIETTHTPVVENIHYEAVPVNCPSTYASSGAVMNGQLAASSLPVEAVPVSSVQAVPVSSVQAVPVSSVQAVPVSSVQAVPVSSVQAIPVSSVQAIPVSSVQAIPVAASSLSSGCGSQVYY